LFINADNADIERHRAASSGESAFWLEFSVDTKMMRPEVVADLSKEAGELATIVCASRATARKKGAQIPQQ